MSAIHIKKEHALGSAEAKRRIMPAILKAASAYGLRLHWEQNVCHFEGAASGVLEVRDNYVELRARLGFVANLIKREIMGELTSELDHALG